MHLTLAKENAPSERKKQSAVMVLDCERLDWDIETIITGLDDGNYDYMELMSELCILDEEEVNYGVPFEWNSLEHFDTKTCLLHYTDMGTQPWVSTNNPLGYLWLSEVRSILDSGGLDISEIHDAIKAGYFRPSLIRDINYGHQIPRFFKRWFNMKNGLMDKACGFVPHKEVREDKRIRNEAIKKYKTV